MSEKVVQLFVKLSLVEKSKSKTAKKFNTSAAEVSSTKSYTRLYCDNVQSQQKNSQ